MSSPTSSMDYVGFSKEEQDIVRAAVYVSSTLGIIGSLIILIPYLAIKQTRTPSMSLIFGISFSDFWAAVLWLPFWTQNKITCSLQAILLEYFVLTIFAWSLFIALTVFQAVIQSYFFGENPLVYSLTSWFVPAFMVFGYLIVEDADPGIVSSAWCSISQNPLNWYRIYIIYSPCALSAVLVAVCVVVSVVKYFGAETTRPESFKLVFYLFSLLICQLPALINRLQNFLDPHHPIFGLFFLHSMTEPIQGLLNGIILGLTEPVFRDFWIKLYYRFYKKREYDEIVADSPGHSVLGFEAQYSYDYDVDD